MPIRWEFHPISAFLEFAPTWDSLNGRAGALPFLESGFLLPLIKHFSQGNERIALAYRGAELIAATIVRHAGLGRWTSFQPSQLPLGPWLAAESEDSASLADSLRAQLPGLKLNLGITQLDPIITPRVDDCDRMQTLDYIQTGWVNIDRSFEMYWEARGKNLRTNMRKQRSKLEADGVRITFDSLTDPSEVPAAIADYGRMESASWKADSGTAVHPDNAQGRFYGEMMRHFCATGRGRIWRLKFDDNVVAMDLCIESHDTVVVLKTTFDAEYRAVSPAFLMRQEAFRQLFDEARIKRIEFYGRLMEWHTRWTEHARTLYHLNVFRWAFIPALRNALRRRHTESPDAAHAAASTNNA
ncbi:MAG TPA: GNAT family N-acetyltransferase [Rhodocyclaceae bacterium]|nr:GNAT family N-acetyltransferase [Rhodocyclaceae bacterium]